MLWNSEYETEKDIVERRVRLMKEEGVLFKTGVNVEKM